ncbi:MAG: hypothetical protein ACLQUZ_14700 [Rhizomicrobium sp.]
MAMTQRRDVARRVGIPLPASADELAASVFDATEIELRFGLAEHGAGR